MYRIGHLNRMKIIGEVHVVYPCPFNSLCHKGVAAEARNVHLIFSKLGREEPDHTHNSTILYWLATRNPLTKPHKSQHTEELTLFPVWVEQHHLHTTTLV